MRSARRRVAVRRCSGALLLAASATRCAASTAAIRRRGAAGNHDGTQAALNVFGVTVGAVNVETVVIFSNSGIDCKIVVAIGAAVLVGRHGHRVVIREVRFFTIGGMHALLSGQKRHASNLESRRQAHRGLNSLSDQANVWVAVSVLGVSLWTNPAGIMRTGRRACLTRFWAVLPINCSPR